MPGSTENTDLLQGLNELIRAQNELTAALVAKSTAAKVWVSSDCGCPPIADIPPVVEDVGPEDDPPPGWSEVEGSYYYINTRKCKVANYNVSELQRLLDIFVIENVEEMVTLYLASLMAELGLVLGKQGGLIASMITRLGWLAGVVTTIATEPIDLDSLVTAVATYKNELVCAHYEAVTTDEATDNVITVLTGAGVSTANLLLIRAIYSIDWLSTLFFDYDDYLSEQIEASTPFYDCSNCEPTGCQLCIAFNSDESSNGIYIELSDTQISMSSGQVSTTYWGICDFNTDPVNGWCGPEVEVNSYVLDGFTPAASSAYRVYDDSLSLIYNSTSPPNWATIGQNVRRIQLKSTTPFSGLITLESA